jgi:hypothetical protein
MSRCTHGFERGVVACEQCGDPPIKRPPPVSQPRSLRPVHPGYLDLTGQTHAGAVVVGRVENDVRGKAHWLIRLPCGHERVVSAGHLRAPRTRWNCRECVEAR